MFLFASVRTSGVIFVPSEWWVWRRPNRPSKIGWAGNQSSSQCLRRTSADLQGGARNMKEGKMSGRRKNTRRVLLPNKISIVIHYWFVKMYFMILYVHLITMVKNFQNQVISFRKFKKLKQQFNSLIINYFYILSYVKSFKTFFWVPTPKLKLTQWVFPDIKNGLQRAPPAGRYWH